MSDSFSGELWQGVAGVDDAILAHPVPDRPDRRQPAA